MSAKKKMSVCELLDQLEAFSADMEIGVLNSKGEYETPWIAAVVSGTEGGPTRLLLAAESDE